MLFPVVCHCKYVVPDSTKPNLSVRKHTLCAVLKRFDFFFVQSSRKNRPAAAGCLYRELSAVLKRASLTPPLPHSPTASPPLQSWVVSSRLPPSPHTHAHTQYYQSRMGRFQATVAALCTWRGGGGLGGERGGGTKVSKRSHCVSHRHIAQNNCKVSSLYTSHQCGTVKTRCLQTLHRHRRMSFK